jgi:hypothetical protein
MLELVPFKVGFEFEVWIPVERVQSLNGGFDGSGQPLARGERFPGPGARTGRLGERDPIIRTVLGGLPVAWTLGRLD